MSLYGNSVIDVSPLSGLTSFVYLYLNNNSITQGVATLTGLINAMQIDLRGNNSIPCADLAILEAALPGVVMHSVTCP
jgi:Leucine-rich repeat (LRR) protein